MSGASFAVLHALRLKGFADTSVIAGVSRVAEVDVAERLRAAAEERLVAHRSGRVSGWTLTPAGRQRHRELVVEELDAAGVRAQIDAAYRGFLAVNGELLEACTAWQVRNGAPNDHTDRAYDDAVVGRLAEIDDAVQPVCRELGSALSRFGDYGPRLARARQRVESGEHDWFTRPMIDSYHTVWFELHEDLLATLGIERSREVSG